MERSHRPQITLRPGIIVTFILMLSLAFIQCFRTTQDLHWAADPDFDRDISYVQGTLDGRYGMDPSYAGEYLWYNPLLFSIETLFVKATGMPVHDVVTRAGAWLNMLGPIAFFIMAAWLLGIEVAIASTLSYLFLASGNILGWGAATFSPWLYPVCFAQWMFYIDVLLCYKAFSTGKFSWFAGLGAFTGILFLGHTAPAVLIVLIMVLLQAGNLFTALRGKDASRTRQYLLQGALALLAFLITSLPLTWFVVGKYHLHSLNRDTFEYTEGIFILKNFPAMIKANLSVSLLVALIGFAWFRKNNRDILLRKILFAWLGLSVLLYCYSTLVAQLDWKYHIHLPGTVPSFHYFFYVKALQSLFFGFGFIYLFRLALNRLIPAITPARAGIALLAAILVCTLTYYPYYIRRDDFTVLRRQALDKQNEKDKVGAYDFIVRNIPADKVILCPAGPSSLFPVMATGRKMVSTAFTFSNPYVDFIRREKDRNTMVDYLCTGQPTAAREIFPRYNVAYALIPNNMLNNITRSLTLPGNRVFSNDTYTLYSLDTKTTYSTVADSLRNSYKSKL
jgi:hypothetical protein